MLTGLKWKGNICRSYYGTALIWRVNLIMIKYWINVRTEFNAIKINIEYESIDLFTMQVYMAHLTGL